MPVWVSWWNVSPREDGFPSGSALGKPILPLGDIPSGYPYWHGIFVYHPLVAYVPHNFHICTYIFNLQRSHEERKSYEKESSCFPPRIMWFFFSVASMPKILKTFTYIYFFSVHCISIAFKRQHIMLHIFYDLHPQVFTFMRTRVAIKSQTNGLKWT